MNGGSTDLNKCKALTRLSAKLADEVLKRCETLELPYQEQISSDIKNLINYQNDLRNILERHNPRVKQMSTPANSNNQSSRETPVASPERRPSFPQPNPSALATSGQELLEEFCRKQNQTVNLSDAISTVYILQLVEGKYYVGRTKNLLKRFDKHVNCKGSEWTRKYEVVSLVNVIQPGDEYEEDKQTRIYMDQYGIDNVRGGTFAKVELDKDEKTILKKMQTHAQNRCFQCHQIGHFAHKCPTFPPKYYFHEPVNVANVDPSFKTIDICSMSQQRRQILAEDDDSDDYDSDDYDSDDDSDDNSDYYHDSSDSYEHYRRSDYVCTQNDFHPRKRARNSYDNRPFCTRCKRDTHWRSQCFAKYDANGRTLWY